MHTGSARWLPIALAAAVAGCHQDPEPLDHHVEDLVTIAQGLYGQVIYYTDIPSEEDDQYSIGFPVDVFAVPPGADPGEPVASTVTGERGFFELALEPGEWLVCTRWQFTCVTSSLAPGERLRLDYAFAFPGWWSGGAGWPPRDPP
jgi:hypothetical protein